MIEAHCQGTSGQGLMQNWVRPRDAWIQKHKSGGTTIISEPFGVLFQCTHSIQKQPVMRKYHKELRKGSMPCQMLQCLVASPRGHLDACRFQCQLSLQCRPLLKALPWPCANLMLSRPSWSLCHLCVFWHTEVQLEEDSSIAEVTNQRNTRLMKLCTHN
jgi:hypothetical protein